MCLDRENTLFCIGGRIKKREKKKEKQKNHPSRKTVPSFLNPHLIQIFFPTSPNFSEGTFPRNFDGGCQNFIKMIRDEWMRIDNGYKAIDEAVAYAEESLQRGSMAGSRSQINVPLSNHITDMMLCEDRSGGGPHSIWVSATRDPAYFQWLLEHIAHWRQRAVAKGAKFFVVLRGRVGTNTVAYEVTLRHQTEVGVAGYFDTNGVFQKGAIPPSDIQVAEIYDIAGTKLKECFAGRGCFDVH